METRVSVVGLRLMSRLQLSGRPTRRGCETSPAAAQTSSGICRRRLFLTGKPIQSPDTPPDQDVEVDVEPVVHQHSRHRTRHRKDRAGRPGNLISGLPGDEEGRRRWGNERCVLSYSDSDPYTSVQRPAVRIDAPHRPERTRPSLCPFGLSPVGRTVTDDVTNFRRTPWSLKHR